MITLRKPHEGDLNVGRERNCLTKREFAHLINKSAENMERETGAKTPLRVPRVRFPVSAALARRLGRRGAGPPSELNSERSPCTSCAMSSLLPRFQNLSGTKLSDKT
jgi:hypothetical protein